MTAARDYDPRLVNAALALHDNRLSDAEPLLRGLLHDDPFDVRAIRMFAELAGRIGRMTDAENLLRRALELAPGFTAARANLALVLYRTNRPAEALSELARVAAPGAALLLSVPLHQALWTPFDDFVGHRRRYEPEHLLSKLGEHGFTVEQSAIYGMRPKSSRLVEFGMWYLAHRREKAMWWYNNVFMPLGVRFQKKLALTQGMIGTADVGEVFLVCRKRSALQSR